MGEQEAGARAATLRDYLRIIGRRKWVVLLALVLVPGSAVGFSLQQRELHEATAQVLIGSQTPGTTPDPDPYQQPDRIIQTQASLARVPDVAAAVIEATGYPGTVADFLQRSSVDPKPNTDLLEFKVRGRSPAAAALFATSYAEQFRKYRQKLDTAKYQRALAGIRRGRRELEAAGQQSSRMYANLVAKEQELRTEEALQTSNAFVVEAANDAEQVAPRPVRNAILGLVLGLVVGLGLALLREALDTRVRSSEELEVGLGLSLLGRLPAPPRRLRRAHKLVTVETPQVAGAEAFRLLRLNVEFMNYGRSPGAIVVTSALAEEGKSTTAANLAVAFARAGLSVAVVDLDLRRPYLHRLFHTGMQRGLTDVVMGKISLQEALVPVVVRSESTNGDDDPAYDGNGRSSPTTVHLLSSGRVPPNPGEFAGLAPIGEVLAELRERSDVVIVDTPPVLQVGDAMGIAPHCDSLLLVTRLEALRRHHVKELRRALAAAPITPLGFVVTGADAEDGYGYGPYDYRPRDRRDALADDTIEAARP